MPSETQFFTGPLKKVNDAADTHGAGAASAQHGPLSLALLQAIVQALTDGMSEVQSLRVSHGSAPVRNLGQFIEKTQQVLQGLIATSLDVVLDRTPLTKGQDLLDLIDTLAELKDHIASLKGKAASSADAAWYMENLKEMRRLYGEYHRDCQELLKGYGQSPRES